MGYSKFATHSQYLLKIPPVPSLGDNDRDSTLGFSVCLKSLENKGLKKLLIGLVALFAISFIFLDGWPFRSPEPESESPENKQAQESGNSGTSQGQGTGAPVVKDSGLTEGPDSEALVDNHSTLEADALEAILKNRGLALKAASLEDAKALSALILDTETSAILRRSLLPAMRQAAHQFVFNPRAKGARVDVRIASGDSITKIARRVKSEHQNNVTAAFIMKVNRLNSSRIRVGNLLAVPTASIEVVIFKAEFRLFVLLGDLIVLDYEIGTGVDDSTPVGAFRIAGKTKNPDWTMDDGRVVPFGDPEHVIGSRWMGFATDRGRTSYGIHGTTEPETIGKSKSEGCIRMLKADIEALYDLVPEGAKIQVRD